MTMRIIDLIQQLTELRTRLIANSDYLDVMGEPDIGIDIFKPIEGEDHKFQYAGFMLDDIKIEPTADGVYYLMSAFEESYKK